MMERRVGIDEEGCFRLAGLFLDSLGLGARQACCHDQAGLSSECLVREGIGGVGADRLRDMQQEDSADSLRPQCSYCPLDSSLICVSTVNNVFLLRYMNDHRSD